MQIPDAAACRTGRICLHAGLSQKHCREILNNDIPDPDLYTHHIPYRMEVTYCTLWAWCAEAGIPVRIVDYSPITFGFKTPADAIAFKLRWC